MWTRNGPGWPQLLRPLGLRIAAAVAALNGEEPRKTVVFQSFRAVIFRSIIHLIPASVTAILVWLNLAEFFIGRELQGLQGRDDVKLGALQFAAKLQELFVLSSLGSIILHVLRERLLFGEGVPFGLLGSDKAFAQISFFWSIDFWGGGLSYIRRKSGWRHRVDGAILISLLVFGGIVAVMAGPATAVLMIPRVREWSVGGGMFHLNRTGDILWPSALDATYGDASECSTTRRRLNNPHCPSGGFEAVFRAYDRAFSPIKYAKFDVDDEYLRKVINTESVNDGRYDTWAYTTHGPTADFQDEIITAHTEALNLLKVQSPKESLDASAQYLDLADTRLYQVETQIPLVRTICEVQPTLTTENGTWSFTFAKFEPFEMHRDNEETGKMEELDVFEDLKRSLEQRNVTLARDTNLVEAMVDFEHVVVPIKTPDSLNASIAIVYFRRADDVPDDDLAKLDPFHVTTCTVEARWVQGRSIQEFSSFGDMHQPHGDSYDVTYNSVEVKLGPADSPDSGLIDSRMSVLNDIHRGTVHVHPDWFDDALCPYVSDDELPGHRQSELQPNRTTAERLLEAKSMPDWIGDGKMNLYHRGGIEVVVSSLFADGLSRCGLDSPNNYRGTKLVPDDDIYGGEQTVAWANKLVHHGSPNQTFQYVDFPLGDGRQRADMPVMTMEAIFTGYAMGASSAFDKFCIALLLSHALVALLHTIWCFFSGFAGSHRRHGYGLRPVSHETWDTVPQLLALSQQSPPAPERLMSNVCGGVQSFQTAGTVAVVECSGSEQPGGEELQLKIRQSFRYYGENVAAGQGRGGYSPVDDYGSAPRANETYGLKSTKMALGI